MTTLVLNPGTVTARTLILDDPLSFWGGYDPRTGEIIDRRHAQTGCRVGGKVAVIPRSRGSAGTPAGIAESIRLGVGPAAIILGQPDVNIAIGAMTAARLYGIHIPVIAISSDGFRAIGDDTLITIRQDGTIES